jgi:hypothetical protein
LQPSKLDQLVYGPSFGTHDVVLLEFGFIPKNNTVYLEFLRQATLGAGTSLRE